MTFDTMGVSLYVAALDSTQPVVALYPRVNFNVEANEIRPSYFSLYLQRPVQVETWKLIKLLSEVVA